MLLAEAAGVGCSCMMRLSCCGNCIETVLFLSFCAVFGQKISLKKEVKKEVTESAVPNLIENLIVSIGIERESEIIDKLYQLALECPGSKRLVLKIEGEKESVKMETNVMVSDTLLQKLRQIGQNTQRVA